MSTESKPRLLDEVRNVLRLLHYSIHTEKSYLGWIRQYIHFHKMRSRGNLQDAEEKIEAFLTHLAVNKNIARATQNQALNALVFLYKRVLKQPLDKEIRAVRATKRVKVPVVMTKEETAAVIAGMQGVPRLAAMIMYGSGLRISETIRLRVQDIDFEMKSITVRSGKGGKDRITTLPTSITDLLKRHLIQVKATHTMDVAEGYGTVYLPTALARKYPKAESRWEWQYAFPSRSRSIDPRGGITRRHHIDPSVVNKAIRVAVRKIGLTKRISAHTFRHGFATHLLQRGTDIRTIQSLLGHKDVSATMIYTHVPRPGGEGVTSPLDDLALW